MIKSSADPSLLAPVVAQEIHSLDPHLPVEFKTLDAKSLLVRIEVSDPMAIFAAATLLLLTAFLAAWLPSARAANIEPIRALRHD